MSRRPTDAMTLSCPLTEVDRAVIEEMKRAAGVSSDANLARIALWSLADHLDLPMPNTVFDLCLPCGNGQMKAQRNPKVRQHDIPRQKPKTPAADHPWRGYQVKL
jgi:hypothetical protein